MNAPLRQSDIRTQAATLNLFALFHLNLAFSSIEEEQREAVIARCYWPLLQLAEVHGPIGLEATAFTLEEIARRDPAWIAEARRLIETGKVELIGSGYAQIIGPLVPARVTEANLAIGNKIYRQLLGTRPALALVNEQAYSAGLVGLYLDAGYRAILMDWDNPSAHHPEWTQETRHLPQRALGTDGRSIALLWTNTVAFQKLQRFAHGDIALGDYLGYLRARQGESDRTLCLYASDAEIFNFRPGRYKTEEQCSDREWALLAKVFAVLGDEPGMRLVGPGEALSVVSHPATGQTLRLESAACPVPVKKQRKYNLSRWAVTGRDDLGVNAACERIYRGMIAEHPQEADWKELCYLWSSDFRTHITEARWAAYCTRLKQAERQWTQDRPAREAARGTAAVEARHIEIETPALHARIDRRRGLALQTLRFFGHPCATVGGLPHGHFDDIALQADWYTGDCVFEAPGEHKITDLEWCETRILAEPGGSSILFGRIETPRGAIEKTIRFHAGRPRVDFDLTFDWADWSRGSLRLGHITLLPDAFEWEALALTTHNGGREAETFRLHGAAVEHGAPVSFLVSSSFGIGMTEGWAEIGDNRTRIRVEVDRGEAPLLGLLTHKRVGGSLFCQLTLSALELDETRKPSPYLGGPRRFRFSIGAA